MNYTIKIEKKAEKFLKKVPTKDLLKLIQVIDALAENPRPRWVEKIKGTKESIYRLAWGNYRILYTIVDDKLLVIVVDVNDRKDVYKNL